MMGLSKSSNFLFESFTTPTYQRSGMVGETFRSLLDQTHPNWEALIVDDCSSHNMREVRMRKTYYDDFDCWLRILKPGRKAYGLDEDLMRYRVMSQSVSRNKRQSAIKVWRAYRDLEQLSMPVACWYFANYAVRGLLKYGRY